jgi:hypothetical protein
LGRKADAGLDHRRRGEAGSEVQGVGEQFRLAAGGDAVVVASAVLICGAHDDAVGGERDRVWMPKVIHEDRPSARIRVGHLEVQNLSALRIDGELHAQRVAPRTHGRDDCVRLDAASFDFNGFHATGFAYELGAASD